MENVVKVIVVICLFVVGACFIFAGLEAAKDSGRKEGVCMPDKLIGETNDDRVICQLPDGGVELHKWK